MHRIFNFASLLLIAACGLSTARADSITYNIVDYASLESGWTVSGTITTDGSIGSLSSSDITSWAYTFTNGATVDTYSSSASEARTLVNGGLSASATQLTIGTPGNGGQTGLALDYIGNSVGQGSLDWYREGSFGPYQPGSDGYSGQFGGNNLWVAFSNNPPGLTLTNSENWVIAAVPSAVPEPASIAMVVLGGLGGVVVFARRSRSQRVATNPV
jgi:hypothetical protein